MGFLSTPPSFFSETGKTSDSDVHSEQDAGLVGVAEYIESYLHAADPETQRRAALRRRVAGECVVLEEQHLSLGHGMFRSSVGFSGNPQMQVHVEMPPDQVKSRKGRKCEFPHNGTTSKFPETEGYGTSGCPLTRLKGRCGLDVHFSCRGLDVHFSCKFRDLEVVPLWGNSSFIVKVHHFPGGPCVPPWVLQCLPSVP